MSSFQNGVRLLCRTVLFLVLFRGGQAAGHSAEGADRRESSRIMTVSDIDHVYQPSFYSMPSKPFKMASAISPPMFYSSATPSVMYSGERPGRQMSSFSSNMYSAPPSSYGWADNAVETDQVASSSGWSSGGTGFAKSECDSALGLFSVLGLVAFLTNVLKNITTTTAKSAPAAAAGRKKRNSDSDEKIAGELNRVTNLTVPLLTAVAHAKDGLISRKCTYREVCDANAILVSELGSKGHLLGRMLTVQVGTFLTQGDHNSKLNHDLVTQLLQAGKHGRKGNRCSTLYQHCKQLDMLPKYMIPSTMLGSL